MVHIFGSEMGIFTGAEGITHSFIPLISDPGEAYQVYWSHEIVAIDSATTTVNMAHERPLYDSRNSQCALAAKDRFPPILWKNNMLLAQKVVV